MAIYMVREGRRYGPGKAYGAGDLVQLEPHEAVPLADVLELVEDSEGAAVVAEDDHGEPPVAGRGRRK